MTIERNTDYLVSQVHELRKLPKECPWVEFKRNNDNPEEIGEYLSAISNSAALHHTNPAILYGTLRNHERRFNAGRQRRIVFHK